MRLTGSELRGDRTSAPDVHADTGSEDLPGRGTLNSSIRVLYFT
jgi:hypothetical protein